MNGWKRFDKTLLHNEEDFYSSLSMEDTRDADQKHGEKAWKERKIKNLSDYHNLYVQSDALDNFKNKCIEIYKRHSAPF